MRVLLGVLLLLACRSSLAFAPEPACFSMRATLLQSYRRRLETGMTAVTMAVAGGKKSALLKGIKKPKGTIAIMAEVKRRDPGTAGLEFPIPSVQVICERANANDVCLQEDLTRAFLSRNCHRVLTTLRFNQSPYGLTSRFYSMNSGYACASLCRHLVAYLYPNMQIAEVDTNAWNRIMERLWTT